jgi:predicted RNA binding protein YcfA (HicA-like mRNA interferase family)
MAEFPVDATKRDVIRALERLGFVVLREREHISMARMNADGSRSTLTLPNHPHLKASTIRTACSRAGVSRDEFLAAYRAR